MSATRKNVTGENIRKRRVAAELSQEALAARLQSQGWDLSRAGLSKIEAGIRLVIDAELFLLGKALRCAPADLYHGVDSPKAGAVARQGNTD